MGAPGRRALYLTCDLDRLDRQLGGEDLAPGGAEPLLDDVSTDEIAPAWASYFFDERLAERCLSGLRGERVGTGDVRRGGFALLVAGERFGSGSSRETAPFALALAGVRLVVAKSFAPIFRKNADNIGLFTSVDWALLRRFLAGEDPTPEELVADRDPIAREILLAGGLLAHARARHAAGAIGVTGTPRASPKAASPRPRTAVEKILAAHAIEGGSQLDVEPGGPVRARVDLRFSHEYVTPMAEALLVRTFGEGALVSEPDSVLLFRDHLTFAGTVHGRDPKRLPLLEATQALARTQAAFAERHGIRLFGELPDGARLSGSRAICHEEIWEAQALPGQVVVGSDSHTSTAGAIGCLAFGVGSTELAALWVAPETRLVVPESVRIVLTGRLRPGVTAKDVMLALFGSDLVKGGGVEGRVLEFCGDGLDGFSLGERATLANLSVEAGALTGIVAFDERAARELAVLRGVGAETLLSRAIRPDPGAVYAAELTLDLARVEPMLALPGDPKNVIELRALGRSWPIDIAYGGSCTGSKASDLDAYAAVLGPAVRRGERVAPGVELFVQVGSERVLRYAEERGYLDLFSAAGASVLGPACGACINAGPGASERPEQLTVSAASRNFPGRSGPGRVVLASPFVVAASALAGRLAAPVLDEGAL